MSRYFRLELDPEEVDGPFVTASRGEERSWHCAGCRTTWFDPVPGPLAVDVDAPEDGLEVFGPGVLPSASPTLVVRPAVAEALRQAGVTSFEAHPVHIDTLDDEPADEPDWMALWPTGDAGAILDSEACGDCGRHPGELAEAFGGRLTGEGVDGDLLAVPGWRHATFVTEAGWAALQAAGVGFLRAVDVTAG